MTSRPSPAIRCISPEKAAWSGSSARHGFGQPRIGEDARQLISLDAGVSADAVAALADDLEQPGGPRVLVIDDFHLADPASADALRWLVE